MKYLFLTIFCLLLNICNGQTILALDKANGYKSLKLGDSYSKLQLHLRPLKEFDDGLKLFEYSGDIDRTLFTYDIKNIDLLFANDKLVKITLITDFLHKPFSETKVRNMFDPEEFNSLNSFLESLFGEGIHFKPDSLNKNFRKGWMGVKTCLSSEYDYKGMELGGRFVVTILDRTYFENAIRSEF